jgi:transcriptional regulator with XRE-family HTH domain
MGGVVSTLRADTRRSRSDDNEAGVTTAVATARQDADGPGSQADERDGRPEPIRNGTIPERLNYLFATVVQFDGKPYTAGRVAQWINDNGGKISSVYVLKILRGERKEPTTGYLRLIAQFFEISPSYFYEDDPAPIDGHRQNMMILLREPEYAALLQRYASLPPTLRQGVRELIERMVQADGRSAD